jgi:ketosteroid isomerase-like protein
VADSDDEASVRRVMGDITDALNERDAGRLDSLLSHRAGSTHIGTDPNEWWTTEQLIAGIEAAMSVAGSEIRAVQAEVSIHVLGDVAWAEGVGKFLNGVGGERATRVTGVFVREGGEWRATQIHASIGVPNEAIFDANEAIFDA